MSRPFWTENLMQIKEMTSNFELKPLVPGLCEKCQDFREYKKNILLLRSSRNGHVDCVKACLAAGANMMVYFDREDPLGYAVEGGHLKCVEVLKKARAPLPYSDAVLREAVRSGNEACINLLLEDSSYFRDYFLQYTVRRGEVKVVEFLLQKGADMNSYTISKCLLNAVKYDSVINFKRSVDAGIKFSNRNGSHALMEAVWSSTVDWVRVLIQAGADVKIINEEGNTVLFIWFHSFSVNRLNCCKLVLREPVKVNVTNNHGFNALTYFLKEMHHYQMYAEMKSATETKLEQEFVILLFAAGETVDEGKLNSRLSETICRDLPEEHLQRIHQEASTGKEQCEPGTQDTKITTSASDDVISPV